MGWSPAFSNAHSTSPTILVTNCAYFQILPQPSAPCNVPVAAIRRSEELSSLFSILFGHCSGFWFSPCLQVCFLTLIVFSVVIHNKSRCYIMLQFLSCLSPCTWSSFCLFLTVHSFSSQHSNSRSLIRPFTWQLAKFLFNMVRLCLVVLVDSFPGKLKELSSNCQCREFLSLICAFFGRMHKQHMCCRAV